MTSFYTLPGRAGQIKTFSSLILATLLVAVLALTQASAPRLHASPEVLQQATAHPETPLRVIVQKHADDHAVDSLIARLGGRITTDLYIINAVTAELPASSIYTLAQAAGVRWISLDAPTVQTGSPEVSFANLTNAYIRSIRADQVWKTSGNYQGQGIGVAVVDSGVNPQQDLYTARGTNRLVASVAYNNGWNQTVYDGYGHGNHVAGVIAGNGSRSNGAYIGVAPMSNIINVKVSDDQGAATVSNVVHGLQWIYENRATYNIRVVNLSLNESTLTSYNTSPLCAAAEVLWFNKIVVVVSAGNHGQDGALYPPANDPFVITVGATDDKGTPNINDDTIASFSAYGKTVDGFAKPDLVAPGKNIVSLLPGTNLGMAAAHPDNIVYVNGSPAYFRMSGTSAAAPMVSGAAALLLQDEPNLTPDQVKYRLTATASKKWTNYNAARAGAGYLDAYAAVTDTTTDSANTGIAMSQILSGNGRAQTWNSASWGSASWGSASWGSDYWGP